MHLGAGRRSGFHAFAAAGKELADLHLNYEKLEPYRPGIRSAWEWVIDQYQVSMDKRTGIRTDPNRADDREYIVRLVVRVSMATVGVVGQLPERFS
jgi:predicted helicase